MPLRQAGNRLSQLSRHFSSRLSGAPLRSVSSPSSPSSRSGMSSHSQTMRACQLTEQGDIDVIRVIDVPVPEPGPGQVQYKVEWAGVNFIDTYFRSGIYPVNLPWVMGQESAGTVTAVGPGVDLQIGDKVAAYTAGGSFAEYAVTPVAKTAKLPDHISTKAAATAILQGLTALTFVKEAHEVKKGQYILVQAAAGGLGLLLCQLCKHFGATVIGTTSTQEKAELAKAAGADHVILYSGDVNVVEEVYKITGGEGIDRGVHAVFDGVGKDTFDMDFDLVRRKGTIVTLGNASGPVAPFAPLKLGPKNLKVCRPVLNQYVHTADEFHGYCKELFEILKQGHLKLSVHGEYELSTEGIKQTQLDIMSRKTSGKLLVKVA